MDGRVSNTGAIIHCLPRWMSRQVNQRGAARLEPVLTVDGGAVAGITILIPKGKYSIKI